MNTFNANYLRVPVVLKDNRVFISFNGLNDMGLSIVKSKGTEEEKTEGVIIVAEDKMVNVSLDSSRKQFRPINATVKNCQEQIKDLVREFNRDLNTELKKGAISFEKSPEKPQKPSRRLRYRGPDR